MAKSISPSYLRFKLTDKYEYYKIRRNVLPEYRFLRRGRPSRAYHYPSLRISTLLRSSHHLRWQYCKFFRRTSRYFQLVNYSFNLKGLFNSTFIVTDSYTATSLSNYQVVPDGNASIYSTQNITFELPPEGAPTSDIGVFNLKYNFSAGWKFVRVIKNVAPRSINVTSGVSQISMYIYGDGSGNSPRFRIVDSTNQFFQPAGPSITWKVIS
jgi:hypothetical protein